MIFHSIESKYNHSKLNLFVIFLLIYEISTYIANDMIMPGMIKVVNSFQTSESYVSTSLSIYILGGASLQIVVGPLSDHFGRRPIMIAGAAFFFSVLFLFLFHFLLLHLYGVDFFKEWGFVLSL